MSDRYEIPFRGGIPPLIAAQAARAGIPLPGAQPVVAPAAELAESKVRCHVADALKSLCDALLACEDLDAVTQIIQALDVVKSSQIIVCRNRKDYPGEV